MEGEDLDALVAGIRENGLLDPIVLDTTGTLIDGRNRLRACQLAGIEPTFTTTDRDRIAYILRANVTRRQLKKGQMSMAYASARSSTSPGPWRMDTASRMRPCLGAGDHSCGHVESGADARAA